MAAASGSCMRGTSGPRRSLSTTSRSAGWSRPGSGRSSARCPSRSRRVHPWATTSDGRGSVGDVCRPCSSAAASSWWVSWRWPPSWAVAGRPVSPSCRHRPPRLSRPVASRRCRHRCPARDQLRGRPTTALVTAALRPGRHRARPLRRPPTPPRPPRRPATDAKSPLSTPPPGRARLPRRAHARDRTPLHGQAGRHRQVHRQQVRPQAARPARRQRHRQGRGRGAAAADPGTGCLSALTERLDHEPERTGPVSAGRSGTSWSRSHRARSR